MATKKQQLYSTYAYLSKYYITIKKSSYKTLTVLMAPLGGGVY